MSFPKYGELAMNIKRPAGEFGKNSDITIEDGPEFAVMNWSGNKYQIWAEACDFDEDFDPRSVNEPDYEWNIEDFTPKGVILDRASLRSLDDKPIDKNRADEIIEHFAQYYESQGLKVEIK